jgi:hypothetical protein
MIEWLLCPVACSSMARLQGIRAPCVDFLRRIFYITVPFFSPEWHIKTKI